MIELPTWCVPNGATPRLMDFGGFLQPALGGAVQRINRMGSRFAISVTLPPLPSEREGRIVVSRLIRAKSEGLRIEYPLADFVPGVPGCPVIDGSGQAGRAISIRSATPGYAFKEGQPISIENAGQHFLHFVDAPVTMDAAGRGTVELSPMLRVPFADGAVVHIARPMIEGFVMGDELAWEMALEGTFGISFDLVERQ